MRIYTSYYGNMKNLPATGYKLGITLYPPRWYSGPNSTRLAPTKEIFHLPVDLFKVRFAEELARLDPKATLNFLESLSEGRDIFLLCYEKPEQFCHRQMVADWLNSHFPFLEVTEYMPAANNNFKQMDLFGE